MNKGRKILVVDDGDNARRSLSRLLELAGYETFQASSGEDALSILDSEKIDLTLLDVVMPGRGGLETACKIKERSSDTRVVLMSSYARRSFSKHGLPAGVHSFLSKPIEPDEILDAVERELCFSAK